MSPQLSPHFALAEFNEHDGVPVPHFAIAPLKLLCRLYLEPLRRSFGPVRIMSGYRTESYNREVGGAQHSKHIYALGAGGVAADVVAASGHPLLWYELLDRLQPGGLGLYSGHVHVDNRPGPRARWSSAAE